MAVLKKLTNHFNDDLSEGAILYCKDLRAYVVQLKSGTAKEEMICDSEFYTSYLQLKLHDVLKKGDHLKNLKHYQISLCLFDDEHVDFEIFKFSDNFSKVPLSDNIPCDFHLKVKEKLIPVNSQILIQKGGEIMSAFVTYALGKKSPVPSLHLYDYSFKVVENYKKFIALDREQFQEELKNSSIEEICDLYEFAQNFVCEPLQNFCANYLALHASSEHLNLLKTLLTKYKDEAIQEIYDKFQPNDLMFDLSL